MWHQWFNCNFMKLWEYFVCKENKNNFIQQFLLFCVSWRAFTRVPWRMRVVLLTQEPASWCRTQMRWALFASKVMHTHTSWCRERASTDTEEKLLNKVIIFVFFAHKKYYHSFIKLTLNHWCHMDYFNNVLTTFLGLERGSSFAVYAGSESSRTSSHIC